MQVRPVSDPVLSCRAAADWERELLADEPAEWRAMQQAGLKLADAVEADFLETGPWPDEARLLVLVGKGHNGGDALIAANLLLARRPRSRATLLLAGDAEALKPLTRRALVELRTASAERTELVACSAFSESVCTTQVNGALTGHRFDLALDGLLGMAFSPPLRPPMHWITREVNRHPAIRFRAAIDLPSGLGDKGCDPDAFRADFTYATGIAKSPLFAAEGQGAAGRIRYLDLDFFRDEPHPPPSERVLLPALLDPLAALRPASAHKGSFGHLLVLAGSTAMPGAAVMAVEAALRAGAGLVTAAVPAEVVPACAARIPEAMWLPWPVTPDGHLALEGLHLVRPLADRLTAFLAGPGLGREPESLALLEELSGLLEVPWILDADALQPDLITRVRRDRPQRPLFLTPHPGEFRRIAKGVSDALIPDAILRGAAAGWGATIILKGAHSRVCTGETVFRVCAGGPVLARGGSGDILAGLLAGLAASRREDPLTLAAMAALWHARAADLLARDLGQTSVRTTQLLDRLAPALHHVHPGA
ncbi:MAG: NAD(P)H-hydrate dehydratase [Puniceicoccaceae bacterium]|nr:MAG: NAD(P)H-hydrate dehydratase [Puniceicoccaceae bacterium]